MNSLRKWLYKPKKTDKSLLAQFYFADEELNTVAAELDGFDSRKDPERCQALVTQLRACQDKVLTIIQKIMTEAIPETRTSRDFRVKFPDDVVQENLAGQLWFGAECLAAGSSIMNRELESASMRPLARALTKNLDSLRHMLRDQCLVNVNEYTERIKEALIIFDKLFAEFELSYVSAMVPVKSVKEYETIQEITVLFSETAIRAKGRGYITTDMIDEYDPALMFTIPRLAIVCGLLNFADGPLNPDHQSVNMSDMFRPFQTLLYKIRELLFTLTEAELLTLERALCSQEEPDYLAAISSRPAASSATSTSTTTTTGVQTDSPPVKKKVREKAADGQACISSDRLGTSGADGVSLTAEDQRGARRSCCVDEIVCQTGRTSETVPSDALFCNLEDGSTVADQQAHSTGPKVLNKSDSNDSGLHSEVVSASESQFTISSSDSIQLLSQSGLPSPLQSPVADGVTDPCMDEGEVEGDRPDAVLMSGTQQVPVVADLPGAAAATVLADDGCDKGPEPVEEDLVGDRDSVEEEEEESYYTPSQGVSPLHQPCISGDSLPAGGRTNAAAQNICSFDDEDNDCNKENIEGPAPSLRTSHEGCDSHLQECQAVVQSLADDTFTMERPEGLTDSSLMDNTLTGLTPATDDMVPPDSPVSCCAPRPNPDSAVDSASASHCDTANTNAVLVSSDMTLKQSPVSDYDLASVCETGANSTDIVSHADTDYGGSGCEVDVETSGQSHTQCDRCTQTPHSAINNDQSSKIHHHHHQHNCQHSSPPPTSLACTASAQNSPHTSHSTKNTRGDSQQTADTPNIAHSTSAKPQTPCSETVKKHAMEKGRRSGSKRARSSKTHTASHRTQTQRLQPQNQELDVVARLRQYADNWSSCGEGEAREREGARSVRTMVETSSGSSGCEESTSTSECESDEESCGSSETSSYNSESHDDEEIALAVQAAELANRNQARARFRSSSDMIHRLFVCISGVADQLQTNFAGDLRNILRVVFNLNCSEPVVMEDEKTFRRHRRRGTRVFHQQFGADPPRNRDMRDPPAWIPDDQSTVCMSCKTPFTFVRRRHHCRNCGKIFCGRCSSNAVSLPHFGHSRPVRVCNHCFVFQVNPFDMQA